MRKFTLMVVGVFLVIGCSQQPNAGNQPTGTKQPNKPSVSPEQAARPAPVVSLADARKGFVTKLNPQPAAKEPVAVPPKQIFNLVQYDSDVGKLAAYVSPNPNDGKKHPAIIWITGGDCNSIDDGCWTEGKPANDQSASAYRKAGLIMMFPSLRGGNSNPGKKEGFLGEVNDVIAAADYLSKQDYVDPKRIYLGGHSTGGTMALLVSEYTDKFRAVFSFGPIDHVNRYDDEFLPYNRANNSENNLRSPIWYLSAIKSKTFVLEGAVQGNIESLQAMSNFSKNPQVQFIPVQRANHFSILYPLNRIIAAKVVADTGPECNITITEAEANAAFGK